MERVVLRIRILSHKDLLSLRSDGRPVMCGTVTVTRSWVCWLTQEEDEGRVGVPFHFPLPHPLLTSLGHPGLATSPAITLIVVNHLTVVNGRCVSLWPGFVRQLVSCGFGSLGVFVRVFMGANFRVFCSLRAHCVLFSDL